MAYSNTERVFSEEEIIEGCRHGKAAYQEKLYQMYSHQMMGVCIRYTKSRFDAEDVFHEAFVKVFKNIHQYNGGTFGGWMRRIVVNTAINHYRKNYKYKMQLDYSSVEEVTPAGDDVISQISGQELLKVINQLPDGYRLVFNMYVVEGYTHNEIAELLQIAEGTSKSQLAKAKSTLRKILQNKPISEAC